jgi:hypothetical protein
VSSQDPEALKYFNEGKWVDVDNAHVGGRVLTQTRLPSHDSVAQKPFSQQAVAFLNAYWPEVNAQAEFIYRFVPVRVR